MSLSDMPANSGTVVIWSTLPPHGGPVSSVQFPGPVVVSWSSVVISEPLSKQLVSKYTPVVPEGPAPANVMPACTRCSAPAVDGLLGSVGCAPPPPYA